MSYQKKTLIKKLIDKHKNDIQLNPPQIAIALFNKTASKKKIDFSKIKNKTAVDTMFKLVDRYFYNLFYKGEAIKSLKSVIVGPILMELNNVSSTYIAFMKGNQLIVEHTLPFAYYDEKKNTFAWISPNVLKIVCKDFFNMPFCKYNTITNISKKGADMIVLWFRAMWWKNGIKLTSFKKFKTYNLVIFNMEIKKNHNMYVYTLSNMGYKDPKYTNKLSAVFGCINDINSLYGKKKK